MTQKIKIFKTSLSSIVKGMAAPAQVYKVNVYSYPHKSDLDAMRKDWELVGNAFRAVIRREYGKAAAK